MTALFKAKGTTAILAAVILLQGVAALFFSADALGHALRGDTSAEAVMEMFVSVMLFVGLVLGIIQLRHLLEEIASKDRSLDVARGQLADVVKAQFGLWKLTPAESEVALFALKGLDVAEIAALRGAAAGTVRAQLTRIYAKAEVSNRAQLAAFFVEDLLADPVETAQGVPPA